MYLKNTASQKLEVFAFDYSTGAPKTGDAANITAYVNIDEAGYAALTDTSATEVDSTNKKGLYLFDLTQGETNGTKLAFFAKSSTANVSVVARPAVSFTQPATGILAPTTAGRTLDVSAGGEAGLDWANVGSPTTTVTLSGTTVKTATDVETDTQDIQSRLPAALTAAGLMKADAIRLNGSSASAATVAALGDTYDSDGYLNARFQGMPAPETIGSTGNTTTTIHVPNWGYGDDEINDQLLAIFDVSNGEYHSRWVSDWVNSTKLATVATLPFTPESAVDKVYLYPMRRDELALAQAFPSNFASLGINGSGHISRVTLTDTLTTYTGNTPQTADHTANIAAIKTKTDFLPSATAGAAGGVFIAGSNAATTVNITGSLSGSVGSVTGGINTAAGVITTLDGLDTAQDTQHSTTQTYLSTNVGLLGVNLSAIPKTGYKLASDGLDSVLVESSISAGAGLTNDSGTQLTSINGRQALALIASACGAVLAGAATTNITFKPAGKPSGNTRIDATVTADGNRTSISLKVPD